MLEQELVDLVDGEIEVDLIRVDSNLLEVSCSI
jgi:hypothetical protein